LDNPPNECGITLGMHFLSVLDEETLSVIDNTIAEITEVNWVTKSIR
jgi:hypothetical protein